MGEWKIMEQRGPSFVEVPGKRGHHTDDMGNHTPRIGKFAVSLPDYPSKPSHIEQKLSEMQKSDGRVYAAVRVGD
jgi:hypothetical protein